MKIKDILVILFIVSGFFFLGELNKVQAWSAVVANRFLLELPDGSTEEIRGMQVIAPSIDFAGNFAFYAACHDAVAEGYIISEGYHCISKSSCAFKSHIMPYMPGKYNSAEQIYKLGNQDNGAGCSQEQGDENFVECSHSFFYGQTFTDRFSWFPYEESHPRGSSHAYWSATIDSFCTTSECHGVPVVSTTGYGNITLRDKCCNPREMSWYGVDNKPDWAGDDIGEVVREPHIGALHNQWHESITWTLKLGSIPPITAVIGPNDCHRSTETFTVNVSDPDFDTVKEIELTINDRSTPYTYSFNLETGIFTEPAGSPFEIEPPTLPPEGASVTVDLTVTNLEALGYQQYRSFSYQARARDENDWGAWSDLQSFNEEWYYPSPTITASPDYEYQVMEVTFSDNSSKQNECQWSASPSHWAEIGETFSQVLGTGQCNGSHQFTPMSDGNYNFSLKGEGGLCGIDDIASTASPYDSPTAWLMTGWGDVYAYNGISSGESMKMWKITDNSFSIPTLNDWAYFSTYIISKSDAGGLFPISDGDGDGKSKRGYRLDKYVDHNTEKVGAEKVYDYLKELAEENECLDSVCKYNEQPSGCNGLGIYFIDNGDLNIGTNFSEANENNACVFIVKNNVRISGGVTELEAFFLVDGAFITDDVNQKLEIDGGIIANNVDFKRYLANNFLNPSETINYNSKYLDLLRDYLGEGYPSKIREYKYSSEQ